ncbi:MAG: helix-turn-helix transcriptional regulator [Muribaculaceae bacterium]|nr:helix-turn-helix transcriptional regulator [Muribaculaceae bacterium]
MDELNIAYRLKLLIESFKLSDSQFADKCGIARPTLSLILSGKNKKISDVLLSQIHQAFPEVSITWLLFGEGEMLNTCKEIENEGLENSENSIFKGNSVDNSEELNLVNSKQLEEIIQNVINKSLTSNLSSFKENLENIFPKDKNRRVVKIMVYYDDSTFESFIPENPG